jgi:outer membrane protein TolC
MTPAVRVCAALALVFCARPALAQTPVTLSLEDAVTRALEHAPKVAEALAREAAAGAAVTSRSAQTRPTGTAAAGYTRQNHVPPFGVGPGDALLLFPDIPNRYRVRAEVGVPLFTSGRLEGFVDAAQADQRAAAADRLTIEADLRLEVTRAYWLLVVSRQAEEVLVQAVGRADASVADVKSRVDAGVLPPNDLLSAEAQRAREYVRLVQARRDAAVAEMDLARLVGELPGARLVTTTAVDRPTPAAAALAGRTPEALVKDALDRRPERAGLLERRQAVQATAEAALAATRPQIGAVLGVEPARPNQRFFPLQETWKVGWDGSVNMSWLVFDSGRAKAERAAGLAQADAIGHRLRDFDAQVAVDVRRRLLDLDAAAAALEASFSAVAAATEARRVVAERFQAGVATSTDVLNANLDQLEAELERLQLQAGQRLAEAALLRSIGGR